MKISTLKKGLQKRKNPKTGETFKFGEAREDGKLFWGYTTYIKADGFRAECWLDPEKWEAHRANTAKRHWARRGADCTKETRSKLFKKQDGRCSICNRHESEFNIKLGLDHCHNTNKVRGLLCTNCNHAIGHLKDSPELCFKAAEYLIKHSNLFTELVNG